MKKTNFTVRLLAAMSSSFVLISALTVAAAETPDPAPNNSASATPDAVPQPAASPARLPYGVEDVVKLSRAQISEDIILNYVQNSGTVYNLGPNDIVNLRNEGVSDHVVNAMLDQRKKLTDPAVTAQNQAAAAPAAQPVPAPYATQDDASAQSSQPAPVYVQPPLQPPPSTVYVIPDPAVSYAYYGPHGYYYPYPYYYGPRISLGFRFGGGHRHHGRW